MRDICPRRPTECVCCGKMVHGYNSIAGTFSTNCFGCPLPMADTPLAAGQAGMCFPIWILWSGDNILAGTMHGKRGSWVRQLWFDNFGIHSVLIGFHADGIIIVRVRSYIARTHVRTDTLVVTITDCCNTDVPPGGQDGFKLWTWHIA